jgi:hypothetical protein
MKYLLLALLAMVAAANAFAVSAEDNPNVRVALALALATQPAPVARATSGRTAEQAAKAALAEALGIECDCGVCDSPKLMPTVQPSALICKPACVERVTYPVLRSIAEKLKPGESIRVFDRVAVQQTCDYTATIYELSGDGIPGQQPGIWRCYRPASGEPTMQRLHLTAAK